MSSVRAQFAEVQEQLNQVHSLVDSNTPSDLNKAATILKSLLPVYKDLSGNEESKRPENLEILKEIKSRLTEETQRVMSKKEEAKSLQIQQQQQQQQQLLQQQQQQILESTTRNRQASQQELPKPPILSGYLKKQGDKGLVRSFKKRWFLQRDTKLFYYEKEGDSEPYGFVNLPEMINVKTVDSGFELATPSRVYVFQVFKPSDLTYWTEGLKEFKKYYQSLQNSQKFGNNANGNANGNASPNMSSSGSYSDFRKYSESSQQPLNSSTGAINTTPQRGTPIKDRRGTVSGGTTEYSHSSSSTAPDSPTLSSSYVPPPSSSLNPQDEELKRRENEIIRKHQEKLKQQDDQQQDDKQQQQSQEPPPPQQQEQLQSQPSQQQQPPQTSPQNSRHGSTNYSQIQQQQQQQQPQSQQSSPQVIISNNNSPRFESQQQQNNFHNNGSNINLESFRQSIEDELNKKFLKEKQDLMEFEIKKRLEIESEIKKLQLQLDQTKTDAEEKQSKSSNELKKKKAEIEDYEARVTIITKRNEEMDAKIKELESSRPVETFPHEFLWTEEVNSRDLLIASQSKRILELEEQLKLKDNAVTVIKRENEMLRQETEKKDKYINELLEKGGSSGIHANSNNNYNNNSNSNSNNNNSNSNTDKIKESMVAHQTQNAFLLQEIQRLETQSQFKLDIKIQQIEELENQLEQQLYQFHRFREAIIGTMSNEYCVKIEKENLDVKKEYFQSLGVSIKLHRVKEGYFANIDINSLFDKVIKENVHYRNWPEWISNQFNQA
ncbi:hypothetical protein ACTFIW_004876 [Dictyostelium discoideum]